MRLRATLFGIIIGGCGAEAGMSTTSFGSGSATTGSSVGSDAPGDSGAATDSAPSGDSSSSDNADSGGETSGEDPATTGDPLDPGDGTIWIGVPPMTSLGNIPIRSTHSIRFKAEHTAAITGVRQYFIAKNTDPNYASGDGGVIRIEIATDDDGMPGDPLPGQVDITFPDIVGGAYAGPDWSGFINDWLLGHYELDEAPMVEAGEHYHVLYTNLHPDPTNNWISSDHQLDLRPLDDGAGPPIDAPSLPPDLALTLAGAPYSHHPNGHNYIPIFQVAYDNGAFQGNGYIEWEHESPFVLSGNAALRTTIHLPESTSVSELAAQVPLHATGEVELSLETIDGDVLGSGTSAADGVRNHRDMTWAVVELVQPVQLQAGVDYAFVLRPADNYSGSMVPIKSGAAYGFDLATRYRYGQVETSADDGATWGAFGNLYFSMVVR